MRRIFGWNTLKAKTQILLILLFITNLTWLCTVKIDQLLNSFVKAALKQASKDLMLLEIRQESKEILRFYNEGAQKVLQRGSTQILNLNSLFKKVQMSSLQYVYQPYDCLNNFTYADHFQYECSYCYGIFGTQQTVDQIYLNYTGLLNELVYIIDQDFTIYFTNIGPSQYFTQYQGLQMIGYQPHLRPWFINYFNQTKIESITYYTYINWALGYYVMSQLTNITSIDGSLKGVLGLEFSFELMAQFDQDQKNLSIIDHTGLLYVSQFNLQTTQYIYDSNQTGFNEIDFQEMKNYLAGSEYVNNCSNIQSLKQLDLLCRFNTLSSQNQFIQLDYISNTGLIMIIQVNTQQDQQEIDTQTERTENELSELLQRSDLYYTSFRLGIVIITILVLNQIFKQLDHIQDYAQYSVKLSKYPKEFKSLYLNLRSSDPNVVIQLKQAICQLNQKILKSQYCKTRFCQMLNDEIVYSKLTRFLNQKDIWKSTDMIDDNVEFRLKILRSKKSNTLLYKTR